MSTPPYGPMSDFIAKYSALPGKALNAVAHPINTIEDLLGFSPASSPVADPYMLHNDPDIARANASFQKQAEEKLHQMSRPLVKK